MNGIILFAAMAAFPTFTQKVSTEWPSEAEAKAASAEIVELGAGEKYLWTCRWDDRNPNHRHLCKALTDAGMKYTAMVNGGADKEFAPVLREIVAAGGAIGSHTMSHDFMSRLLPMKCFREIMQNRIELELGSQSPVVSFAAPYGLASFGRNMRVCGEACANAGFLGGGEGGGGSAAKLGIPEDRWIGTWAYSVNDKSPDKAVFSKRLKEGIARIDGGNMRNGPALTLDIHPWQSEQGRADLAAMVKEALANTPGLVPMNQNTYIARRLQFLHAKVEKVGAAGRRAEFVLRRPRVCELGANTPILLKLSDGRIIKVDAPADEGVPSTYAEVKDALTVSEDRALFAYAYENTTCAKLMSVEFILRLPPGYEPGVVRKSLHDVAPGFKETLEFSARPPEDPVARQGTFYAAMEVNFSCTRLWTQLKIPETDAVRVACPRDEAVVCGPFLKKDAPADAAMCAMSAPDAALMGVGDNAWFRCDGGREGDATWAVTAARKRDRARIHKNIGWSLPPEDKRLAYMLCHAFEVDTAAHGDIWDVQFSGGHVTKKKVRAFLNGEPIDGPSGTMRLRNGGNRLLVYLFDLDCNMLYTTFEVKSAKDGAIAKTIPFGM